MFTRQDDITLSKDQRMGAFRDLELFKMMLQPHFLFNSLNNLYALSIKKSDQTADAIAGLSGLLSQVVSCSRMEYIPLSREISLIEAYTGLERIWLGEMNFLMDLHVSGETEKFMLPPLVLYTFIENAFKHGVRKCPGDGWLTVRIDIKNETLNFNVQNKIPGEIERSSDELKNGAGIGIAAVKELLEKKCADRYDLYTGIKNGVFHVRLRIRAQQTENE